MAEDASFCKSCGTKLTGDDNAISDYSFFMEIEDVFSITGRGTIVVGNIKKGELRLQDSVSFTDHTQGKYTVTGIESFRKQLEQAGEGMNVGVLLSGIGKNDIKKGTAIVK
jgi:elongation factor Tu